MDILYQDFYQREATSLGTAETRSFSTSDGAGTAPTDLTVENKLAIPMNIYWITEKKQNILICQIEPGKTSVIHVVTVTDKFVAYSAMSGGFCMPVVSATLPATVALNSIDLVDPNEIGTPPKYSANVSIPADSPPVVIGISRIGSDSVMIREQLWRKNKDSFSLAPGETLEMASQTVNGMTQSSSSMETIAKTVGVETSAGWGAISASVSASLSSTSTTSQEVSMSTETTNSVVQKLTNPLRIPVVVLRWQLTDRITWWKYGGTAPIASMEIGSEPLIPVVMNPTGQVIDMATGDLID